MKAFATCVLLGIVPAFALQACKSTDKGEATGTSVTTSAGLIETGMLELDAVIASLHVLTDNPTGDLAAKHKDFEKKFDKLEGTADKISETSIDMAARGNAYFQDWDEQLATIRNEDIREQSSARRDAIEASFEDLQDEYGETRNAFKPLMADLRDVRTAIKADLTVEGLKALQPAVKDIDKEAASAREQLDGLIANFRKLGVEMSRTGPPEPGQPVQQ